MVVCTLTRNIASAFVRENNIFCQAVIDRSHIYCSLSEKYVIKNLIMSQHFLATVLFFLFVAFQLQDVTHKLKKLDHFIWLKKLFMLKSSAFFSTDQDVLSMHFGILVLALFLFLFFCNFCLAALECSARNKSFFMIATIIFISTQTFQTHTSVA